MNAFQSNNEHPALKVDELIAERIAGIEKLTSVFGGWPTFHDAAIEWVLIERLGPMVTIRFRLNEWMETDTDRLAYATLRWHEVAEDLRIDGVDEPGVRDN